MTAILPYATKRHYPYGNESVFASVKKQSLAASSSSSTEISITTKEGDVVTLSSEAFAELESFSYDKMGRIQNDNCLATSCVSYRSMELSAGSSFTFSVEGDLSEGELDDIEEIVATLDSIMEEMASGDMDEAMGIALEMNGYETVSAFSADLSYSHSYNAYTEMAQTEHIPASEAEAAGTMPKPANNTQSLFEKMSKVLEEMFQGGRLLEAGEENGIVSLLEQMTQALDRQNQEGRLQTAQPVDQLFDHHLGRMARQNREETPGFKGMLAARDEMRDRINRILQQPLKMFQV